MYNTLSDKYNHFEKDNNVFCKKNSGADFIDSSWLDLIAAQKQQPLARCHKATIQTMLVL